MAVIKNIIFDLGGVLLDIDYHKTEKAFIQLGFDNFSDMYNQHSSDKVFSKLETGMISNSAFYNYMIETTNLKINEEQVKNAWNAILLDFRITSLEFLKVLSTRYQLYLLSNTNAIHQEAFNQIYTTQTGQRSLNDNFKKAYYSHEIGLRKPNHDIFEFVLKDADLNAGESLFIDDSYNNVNTAKNMGIITHLLQPAEKIEDLIYFR